MNSYKNKIYYDEKIIIYKIHELWYYDRFTNIVINKIEPKLPLPKCVSHIQIDFNDNIKDYIPNSVTHLTFGYDLIKILKVVFQYQ